MKGSGWNSQRRKWSRQGTQVDSSRGVGDFEKVKEGQCG